MTADNTYRPAGRLPIGQYRVTVLVTGDAIGSETLSWLIADRLHSMAGGAITGCVELIETLGRDSVAEQEDDDAPNPVCGEPTGRASNRCLLAPGHPDDHDDDPPQEGREKNIVQNVLNSALHAVETVDVSCPHGHAMRSDIINAVHHVADHYGVNL